MYPLYRKEVFLVAVALMASVVFAAGPAVAQKKPNIVMLMTDDTGWNDFGAYTGGGAATPTRLSGSIHGFLRTMPSSRRSISMS